MPAGPLRQHRDRHLLPPPRAQERRPCCAKSRARRRRGGAHLRFHPSAAIRRGAERRHGATSSRYPSTRSAATNRQAKRRAAEGCRRPRRASRSRSGARAARCSDRSLCPICCSVGSASRFADARESFDGEAAHVVVRARELLFEDRHGRRMPDAGQALECRHRIGPSLVVAQLIRQCLHRIRISHLPERVHGGAAHERIARVDVVDERVADVGARGCVRLRARRRHGPRSEARLMASARTRGLLSRSATASCVSTCGGTARGFSASCPAAAASPPATVLTSTTNPIFLRRGTARVVKSERSASMAASCTRSSGSASAAAMGVGGLGIVRVLEDLNGAQPRGGVLVLQAGRDLLERVLLACHGPAEAGHYQQRNYQQRNHERRHPGSPIPVSYSSAYACDRPTASTGARNSPV